MSRWTDLNQSSEARFWVLHLGALLAAFLVGYLVGPRLAPFLSLLLCRPFVALAITLLPRSRWGRYRPYLVSGALVVAALGWFLPPRGTTVFLLAMAYFLLLDISLDALVVDCCPAQEWLGKTAGLGWARSVGLLAGLVVSGSAWIPPVWAVTGPLLLLGGIFAVCGEREEQQVEPETPRIAAVVDGIQTWLTSKPIWGASLGLLAVSILSGGAGTTLFPVVVMSPSTIAEWLADPWTWCGAGLSWVLLALVFERISVEALILTLYPLALVAAWLGGPMGWWPLVLHLILGLATLTAHRQHLTAQGDRVDPCLRAVVPLLLWALGQLLGEALATGWPEQFKVGKAGVTVVMLGAIFSAARVWRPSVRITSQERLGERATESERHGDRTFDFEAAPIAKRRRSSPWLVRLWYLVTVRFPVTLTLIVFACFSLAGLWHMTEQKGSWEKRTRGAWLTLQTELFLTSLTHRLEEEMLASGHVPRDLGAFIGASFQLNGRPMKDRDFWNTPLDFQVLPKELRLRSAGPDKKLFTPDDITRTVPKPDGVK